MKAAARTHVGLVRRRNEDRYYTGAHLAAVADGMGGHVSGDVAATTAIDAVRQFDRGADADRLGHTLASAVAAANTAMRSRIRADPQLAGMGTTLVAAMWSGHEVAVANIGDSRAYLLREGSLRQLTDDHVYERLLSNASAVPHLPEKISRFLDGRTDGRSPDIVRLTMRPGDRLLLCSDGLSSFVPTDVIAGLLASADLNQAASLLVDAALDAGGPDNITVAVIAR